RVFSDEAGRMNKSCLDVAGGVLLVPQFTLPADTRKGKRPSFTPAAPPDVGEPLFERAVEAANAFGLEVHTGQFGADMKVASENDGPVTFWLRVPPSSGS
ncbi:MAG: D-aminoacyl-tRNA deacylase, partial [Pseudomonadota bacterium]